MIKHINFDLWNTLIKSSKTFADRRAEYIIKYVSKINGRLYTTTQVKEVLAEVSVLNTEISMITGKHSIHKKDMYAMVLNKLGVVATYKNLVYKIDPFIEGIDEISEANPPLFVSKNVEETLALLKAMGITMSLISNTGFMNGSSLRDFLEYSCLDEYFQSMYFSDEVGLAKPNPKIFKNMVLETGLKPSEVLHVGDHKIADGGCKTIGCHFMLIDIMYVVGEATTVNSVPDTVRLFNKKEIKIFD